MIDHVTGKVNVEKSNTIKSPNFETDQEDTQYTYIEARLYVLYRPEQKIILSSVLNPQKFSRWLFLQPFQ